MSGLRIMVLTLLLLVLMTTSHQDAGEKQAMQRDAKNFSRRRLGIRNQKQGSAKCCVSRRRNTAAA
uniref:G102 VD Superfamily O3 precursor conopeptide n=1 Tax=Conus geographus TaxID=6491 RepID=X5IY21_CONGE|nr:G102_VD_Superfamily_O3_precursor_conopeptide [Conus geographus]